MCSWINGSGFSQVIHHQLGEERVTQAGDLRRLAHSLAFFPPACLPTFLCFTSPMFDLEMKMPPLSSLWVIHIPLSESKMEKQTPGKEAGAEWSRVTDEEVRMEPAPSSTPQQLSLPFLLLLGRTAYAPMLQGFLGGEKQEEGGHQLCSWGVASDCLVVFRDLAPGCLIHPSVFISQASWTSLSLIPFADFWGL